MSQAKVDYNKEQKKNRKKQVKKRKVERTIGIIAASLAAVALCVWIGFSVNTKYKNYKSENPTYHELNMSSLTEYLNGLNTSELED